MFLVDNLKSTLAEASTLFVHVALIAGVAVYTVFGALSMQWLESPDRVRALLKRELKPVESLPPPPSISGLPDRITRVYLGEELAILDPGVHECLERTILTLFHDTKCDPYSFEHLNIELIDRCYAEANVPIPEGYGGQPRKKIKNKEEEKDVIDETPAEKWSIGNSVIFAFTVITTIGYGHVAPETFEGRLFLIFYGVIGVPFTLLTIADLGMFLTRFLKNLLTMARRFAHYLVKLYQKAKKQRNKSQKTSPVMPDSERSEVWNTGKEMKEMSMRTAREPGEGDEIEVIENGNDENGKEEDEEEPENNEPRKTEESIALGITFTCYLVAGAKILSVYEPEMDFFKALYFNFVTLTTIGLGDFVPKSFDYLLITLIYIGIGLALTTMAIEIAADLLKKLHYIGRKMENVGQAVVWFGGKKMTMKSLVKHLGDQFNIPEEELANFDMSAFVDNAIKVEKGEIATLRKPPTPPVVFRERAFSFSNVRNSSESALKYVDDNRFSKTTQPTIYTVIIHETTRTIDTLHNLADAIRRDPSIPRLDLDVHYLTDMSAPTSFDENYLRTYTNARRK
ncbi:Potassium channel domain-containing protein [Caenorhabditis elegans]|uniref:Potassium channel domain-containing protein n=1 Tax=Caenorhabditis elegans TaxID=6239 RepID=A0A061AD18_CAEEL|nr:Potassium channel domain-containing protein [Caenorhabditis elegans]CDR32785.1 Potassium channel domain-containing protein [Caenorhabditis elegans]|eukprot:NP_001294002.1 TWiK family of potassium channels protein 9 [Caenorhabditis elegans]